MKKRKRRNIESTRIKKKRRGRSVGSVKYHKMIVRDNDGSLREIRPTDTLWYLLYIKQPPANKRLLQLFRKRFRLPYDSFISLSEDVMAHPMFVRWTRCDAVGNIP